MGSDTRRYLFSNIIVLALVATVAAFAAGCSWSGSPPELSSDRETPGSGQLNQIPNGSRRDPKDLPALSTALNRLLSEWRVSPDTAIEQAEALGLEIDDGRIKIMLIMLDEHSADAAEAAIPALGGEVIIRYQTWIDAWAPIESLEAIADLPGLSQAREPIPVLPLEQ